MADDAIGQKYTAPPIIEAIVQVVFADELPEARLRKPSKRFAREYANKVAQKSVEAKIDFPNENVDFTSSLQNKYSSEDETDILLTQPKALTWQRLAPYPGWNNFEGRFLRDLRHYYDLCGPRKIERLGVRYINRIDIPSTPPITHYEEYLNINLSLPDEWPIDKYSWRFERDFPNDLTAIVQSAIVSPEVPNTIAVMLDIDVIARSDLPTKLDDVIARIRELRLLKNEIFEKVVTDRAKRDFDNAA